MLTPAYLKGAPELVVQELAALEDDIARDIARRIAKTGQLTGTAEIQARQLLEITKGSADVRAQVAQYLQTTDEELGKLLLESGRITYESDRFIYDRLAGKRVPPFGANAFATNLTYAVRARTSDEIARISKSIGMIGLDGLPLALEDFYHKELNRAAVQIASGAFSYDQILRKMINTFGDKGLQVIDFASGTSRGMEGHLRGVVLDAVRQLSNEIGLRNAQDLGQDLMEISAHAGARPFHATWQGQIVSLSGRRGYLTTADIGHGDVTGFGGANCRHSWYPFFESSERNYTQAELTRMATETVTVDGETYTTSQAMDRQRAMERSIRKSQRRLAGYDAAGDQAGMQREAIRLRRKLDGLKDFTDKAGLKIDQGRLVSYGYRPGMVTLPPKGAPWTRPQVVKAAKTKLVKAQTQAAPVRQVLRAMDTADMDELVEYYSKAWAVSFTDDVKELNFEAVREMLQGFEDTLVEHPFVVDYFKKVTTTNSGVASMSWSGTLNFNPKYFKGDDAYSAMAKMGAQQHQAGYWTGSAIYHTGRHEAGHLLETAITIEKYKRNGMGEMYGMAARSRREISKEVMTEAWADMKKLPQYKKGYKKADMAGMVSGYARTNTSETWSEAFAGITANPADASEASQIIYARILSKIKEIIK